MPPRKASTKTVTSGRSRKKQRKTTATAISTMRVPSASLVTARGEPGTKSATARVVSDMAKPLAAPRLQKVDDEEKHEGDEEHDGGDRGRPGIIVLLQLYVY